MTHEPTQRGSAWVNRRIRADGRRILPIPYSQDASTHQRSVRRTLSPTETPDELRRLVRMVLVLRHLQDIIGMASDTLTVRAKPFQESGGYIVRIDRTLIQKTVQNTEHLIRIIRSCTT